MGRIFSVRINIDSMLAELDALDNDPQLTVEYIQGFRTGCRGGQQRDGWSATKLAGYTLGAMAYMEARGFSKLQAEKASKMHAKRSSRCADMPRHVPRHMPEGMPESCHIEQSNNRIIGGSSERPATQPPPPPDDGLFSNPAPTLRVPQQTTLGDLEATYPCLLITREDRDRMQAIFRLYGWDILHPSMAKIAAIAAQRPSKQRRVFVSEVAEWLSKNFELEESDYKRAGIPMPSKDK